MPQMHQAEASSPAPRKAVKVISNTDSEATSSAIDAPASPPSIHARDYSSLDIASKRRFKSYRLRGEYEKPWLADPDMNKIKWNNWIVRSFILLGFILAGVACFFLVWPYRDGSVSFSSLSEFFFSSQRPRANQII